MLAMSLPATFVARRRTGLAAALTAMTLTAMTLSGCGDSSDTASGCSTPSATAVALVPAVQNATDLGKKPVPAAAGDNAVRPTQVVTQDHVTCQGKQAVLTDTVQVRYVGVRYRDGGQFDASWDQGDEPATFALNGVVEGFAEGIVGMTEGSRRTIVIPAAKGYGDQDGGADLPPDSDLVFVVDLVKIGA
jgi:peptidylprolyl isomerase